MKELFRQITSIWSQGTAVQRTLAVLSVMVIASGVTASIWLATRPDHALLFGNLEPQDAAEVVEKVRAAGVEAKLGDGGRAVYVPREQVAEMRVLVSSAGLPRGTGAGWELFDESSFGVSDFEQGVRYRRALEGELSRSIAAFEAVESARVSITRPKRSPFLSDRSDPKGSVVVKTRAGMTLSRDNVAAIKHLVAGAVEGLDASMVSVVDTKGRVLAEPGTDSVAQSASDQVELQKEMEQYLEGKARAMLAEVGVAAVVRVALDVDFQQIRQTSETYSPEGRVASETIQNSKTRPATASEGPAGTESKIEQGLSLPSVTVAQEEDQETVETTYKLDRTVKSEEVSSPRIRRMTVSLVVDQAHSDRLAELQQLVRTAVGFDETRGDRIEAMAHAFEGEKEVEIPLEEPGQPLWLHLVERGIQVLGVLGALFLVLRLLKLLDRRETPEPAKEEARTGAEGTAPEDARPAEARPSAEVLSEDLDPKGTAAGAKAEAVELDATPVSSGDEPPPIHERIRDTVQSDPERAARILQAWLRDGRTS